jgi:hypothetical protein
MRIIVRHIYTVKFVFHKIKIISVQLFRKYSLNSNISFKRKLRKKLMVELIVLHLAGICVRNKMLNKRGAETKINLEKRKKKKEERCVRWKRLINLQLELYRKY